MSLFIIEDMKIYVGVTRDLLTRTSPSLGMPAAQPDNANDDSCVIAHRSPPQFHTRTYISTSTATSLPRRSKPGCYDLRPSIWEIEATVVRNSLAMAAAAVNARLGAAACRRSTASSPSTRAAKSTVPGLRLCVSSRRSAFLSDTKSLKQHARVSKIPTPFQFPQ
jgi:hypothetical protein